MPGKRRFIYNDDFFKQVYNLALQGYNNREIAALLKDKDGNQGLCERNFYSMVHGNYDGWAESERLELSSLLCDTLAKARAVINGAVRAKYLKCGLGGIPIKTKTTVTRHLVVDGVRTDDIEVQETVSESQTTPDARVLAHWLYHHDPEWRKIERREDTEEDEPTAEKGIDVNKWIELETKV